MKKLIQAVQGVDTSCNKKFGFTEEKEARAYVVLLKANHINVRGVHFCTKHQLWHMTSQKTNEWKAYADSRRNR